MKALRPSLGLSLQFADPRHRALLPRHKVTRWLRASLEGAAQLTVRIVDDEEGQSLNRDYRGKDYATNVLTFAYGPGDADGGAPADDEIPPGIMADLILCAPVVEREAEEQSKTLEEHYAHLLVHGALHAQGHDHEAPDEAEAMERREREVLAQLGFADPYR
ncbi:MAG: rRNA maturation RNase YbeY [Methylibium sp.]|uniref:rRNA maturation RNase YbeY n=1 Tax=Methylibium sp. TaxID=2067992 RepID=UPI0017A5C539|nr:rRNA maturation RNase YbeY [Methylibium sp.]MBA3598639.1 rRNA maturation RNase YbeY [Methylibium sp.]